MSDDHPQLGRLVVDPMALAEPGTALDELVEELDATLDTESAVDAPADGWRVVSQDRSVILAAPADRECTRWRVAQRHGDDPFRVHPDTMPLRRSRVQRRGGLQLRWPTMLLDGDDVGGFAIDVVNTGDQRWTPDGDSFHVVGVLTPPATKDFFVGWATAGGVRAVALDSGEYARVPVIVEGGAAGDLEEGQRDLRASMPELGLSAEPLPVTITAEFVERHRRKPRRPPREQRAMLDDDIRRLEAMISASRSMPAIAALIERAETDAAAIAAVGEHLSCDATQAESVYHAPLRELRRGHEPELQARLTEAHRRRDELQGRSSATSPVIPATATIGTPGRRAARR